MLAPQASVLAVVARTPTASPRPSRPPAQLLRAGKSEPLSVRRLERCVQFVAANPVLPGFGGAPFDALAALKAEPALAEAAAQRPGRLRVPPSLDALEPRALARLEARYALPGSAAAAAAVAAGGGEGGSGAGGGAPRWVVEGHDQVADLLGLLALEVDQAAARHKEPSDKVRPARAWGWARQAVACGGGLAGGRYGLLT
jgi:hypothetical protein